MKLHKTKSFLLVEEFSALSPLINDVLDKCTNLGYYWEPTSDKQGYYLWLKVQTEQPIELLMVEELAKCLVYFVKSWWTMYNKGIKRDD